MSQSCAPASRRPRRSGQPMRRASRFDTGTGVGIWWRTGRRTGAGRLRWMRRCADGCTDPGRRPWHAQSTGSIDQAREQRKPTGETMHSAFWGELAGTAVLILLGNGVVACVVLRQSYGHGSGWIVITAGWCFAVVAGVFTALALGAPAHLNPAVSLGVAAAKGRWASVPVYVAGQISGAMIGATIVWLHYLPHWELTEDAPGKRACFCTAPAVRRLPANVLSEIIGTFVLVFVAAAIYSNRVSPAGLPAGFGPLLVGFLVWSIGLSLGGT